ncbi:Uncharacterized protein OBRU01_18312 [Operophtera brumata]|uniref:DUF4371 domain-containing protein n=1 Tax=Operophtera brumata TaxID=104452 RepID=A0A0L7KZL6_OPEBR|nr:Uncharacterized protein OBRU01_18312 [Operophtera brumata]
MHGRAADSSEACSSSHIHPEIEESQAHTLSDVHPEIEEPQVNDSDISADNADCNIISSDRGNFGDNLTECERKIIFKLGPFKPQGPFPKVSENNRPFSAYYYSYFNQAGIKIIRPWLCYSNVLNKPYCHFCWLLADRQNKSYSSAWVNGVSVRSNFTQTILDHEKSQQHISASLSYNNWLQGNTIDTLLKSEIDSKITFWRDVLHRIINVIITLVSCNLPLRGHDSDSGNFMAISRLLSNYDATLKELFLKPKGEINYLSPTIQNEIISLLGTNVRNSIISEIKKAPFLTIILDTTQDLSKIDQLSVVFRYISVTENDDNVPKEIKICKTLAQAGRAHWYPDLCSVYVCTSARVLVFTVSSPCRSDPRAGRTRALEPGQPSYEDSNPYGVMYRDGTLDNWTGSYERAFICEMA